MYVYTHRCIGHFNRVEIFQVGSNDFSLFLSRSPPVFSRYCRSPAVNMRSRKKYLDWFILINFPCKYPTGECKAGLSSSGEFKSPGMRKERVKLC